MDLQAIEIGRKARESGENIAAALRERRGEAGNSDEIIEIAYELQAGSYVQFAEANKEKLEKFTREYADLLQPFVSDNSVLLDVGSGELTTLSLVLEKLPVTPACVIGTDISWSRLRIGTDYAKGVFGESGPNLSAISCEIESLPFASKTIDLSISNHALEPNGKSVASLLEELFRVTRGRVVLFEPYYEGSSQEAKNRMELHGYFKGLEEIVDSLGGQIEKIIPLSNSLNKLNQTHCFIISPPRRRSIQGEYDASLEAILTVPGTDSPILLGEGFYYSPFFGVAFPILDGIPILRTKSSILASSMTS